MRAMTVRGLNDSLAEKLKQTAKQEGKSVNQLVIETLKKKFNMEKKSQRLTMTLIIFSASGHKKNLNLFK